MAHFVFETASVEPREQQYTLLPAGWYTAQVTESDIVALKTGNGQAIKLTFDVLSEGYRGRKVWARLNVRHTNPKAEQIGQQQLRELCDAIGLIRMSDTVELHNKPVQIKVKVRVDESGQYEPQNEIIGYQAAGAASASPIPARAGAAVPPAANTPHPAAAAAPAAGTTPPWAKRAA